MTVQNPAIFLQAGSHPAEDVRRFIAGAVPYPGVMLTDDLLVTERSGTANMSVDVAGGRAFIAGSEGTYQGTYFVENRGTSNLVVSAAHATLARIDLIVAKVQDAGYSGATNAWSLAVVAGTPAASPAAPTAPANCLVLARVAVGAVVSTIVNANITDYRYITAGQSRATALGAPIICRSTNRPTTLYRGLIIYETDTGNLLQYYGVTTGWKPPWNLAWGQLIAPVAITTNSATATATVDVTGLSLSVTLFSNRRYKITAKGESIQSVADGAYVISLTDSGGTAMDRATGPGVSAASTCWTIIYNETGAGSAVVRKIRHTKASGTGNTQVAASATSPAYLMIEDIGPAFGTSAPSA